MTHTESVALFLFAHQDDEFGVFQKILDERQKGRRVCCAYLTDGGTSNASPQRRNVESLYVLQQLGVHTQDVRFAGQALGISDAKLHENLESAANWICGWINGFSQVTSICVPAWEGGHHDHDALHAITVSIAVERDILECVRQFSLYNGFGCSGPFFRVLSPLPMNGVVEEVMIPWKHRLRFFHYCLCYPSQAKTWLGIFPFVVFHYLFRGKQALQPISAERIRHRPHDGALYYETRGFFTWQKMVASIDLWQPAPRLLDKFSKLENLTLE